MVGPAIVQYSTVRSRVEKSLKRGNMHVIRRPPAGVKHIILKINVNNHGWMLWRAVNGESEV